MGSIGETDLTELPLAEKKTFTVNPKVKPPLRNTTLKVSPVKDDCPERSFNSHYYLRSSSRKISPEKSKITRASNLPPTNRVSKSKAERPRSTSPTKPRSRNSVSKNKTIESTTSSMPASEDDASRKGIFESTTPASSPPKNKIFRTCSPELPLSHTSSVKTAHADTRDISTAENTEIANATMTRRKPTPKSSNDTPNTDAVTKTTTITTTTTTVETKTFNRISSVNGDPESNLALTKTPYSLANGVIITLKPVPNIQITPPSPGKANGDSTYPHVPPWPTNLNNSKAYIPPPSTSTTTKTVTTVSRNHFVLPTREKLIHLKLNCPHCKNLQSGYENPPPKRRIVAKPKPSTHYRCPIPAPYHIKAGLFLGTASFSRYRAKYRATTSESEYPRTICLPKARPKPRWSWVSDDRYSTHPKAGQTGCKRIQGEPDWVWTYNTCEMRKRYADRRRWRQVRRDSKWLARPRVRVWFWMGFQGFWRLRDEK